MIFCQNTIQNNAITRKYIQVNTSSLERLKFYKGDLDVMIQKQDGRTIL